MTKYCSSCKAWKPISAFHKGQSYCKPCHYASVQRSVKRNPEARKRNRLLRREKELARNREYKKENKERINALNRNRKALMKYGRYDNHTHKDVVELLAKQKGCCAICKINVSKKYHVDHVVPLSSGGENSADNLQILCAPCNCSKHTKDPIEFMQSRGFLI